MGPHSSFAYSAPTIVWFAPDGLARLGSYLKRLGVARAFVVTDAGVVGSGALDLVREAAGGRIAEVWPDVVADAPRASVQAAGDLARAAGADGIVAVGGGSAIDSGKAIALLAKHGGDVGRWDGNNKVGAAGLPLVAIPTTAGTGSEVSNVCVLKDGDKKLVIFDRVVYPSVAVLDPRLTVKLPPRMTAATGVDALTHAVEGISSKHAQAICDAIGLESIRMIREALPRAFAAGEDLEARGRMLVAANMAGQLVANTFVGVAHAVAHALGAAFGVHHGTANGVSIAWSIRLNAADPRAAAQYARCADAFGVPRGASDEATALAFADAVESFVGSLGLPTRLEGVGVGAADVARLAELAFADPSHLPNALAIPSAAFLAERLASLV